jgi:hypothetical protein
LPNPSDFRRRGPTQRALAVKAYQIVAIQTAARRQRADDWRKDAFADK